MKKTRYRSVKSAGCIVILIGIALCLGSCQTDEKYPFPKGAEGYWHAPGYGAILEITSDNCRYFEVTSVSLLEQEFPLMEFPGYYFRVVDENHAVTGVAGTSLNYQLERINRLPDDQLYKTPTHDYQINFEVLWHTFNERYAFFEERSVNWDDVYQKYAERIALCKSEEEFYDLIVEMLDLFDDNHIMLYRSQDDLGWQERDAFRARADWVRQEDVEQTFQELAKLQRPLSFSTRTAGKVFQEELWYVYMDVIQNTYLSGAYISCCQDMIFYGMLNESTGYVAVLKEDSYTGNDGDVPAAGLAILNQALDEMTAYFAGVPNIIIDTRFNWGGTDSYSLAIASRFVDRQDMAFYLTAREGDSQVNRQEFFYNPDEGPCFDAQNIYVLSSPATLSAGECLVMYLGNLENATVVGENTMGIWSTTLVRYLPNGWQFTLSNERLFDPDGVNYEVVGYPPDILEEFNGQGFETGHDAILERTLRLVEK